MLFSSREFWTVLHGLILGGLLLLGFSGGVECFWSFKRRILTEAEVQKRLKRLKACLSTMMLASWLAVLSGTYRIYLWYRKSTPRSPLSRLLSDPRKDFLHNFGMEWKEHVAWLAPLLLTTATYLTWRHGPELADRESPRSTVFWLFFLGFTAAVIAGLWGALIHEAVPFQ